MKKLSYMLALALSLSFVITSCTGISISPEGLSKRDGINWNREDYDPNASEYLKNYKIEQDAISDWGSIGSIKYDSKGFPIKKSVWDAEQLKIQKELNENHTTIPLGSGILGSYTIENSPKKTESYKSSNMTKWKDR